MKLLDNLVTRMDPPIAERARRHGDTIAIVARDGIWTFADLLAASARVAASLLGGAADLNESRIAYMVEPGGRQAAVQLGIWRAGGLAVPLALSHPPAELAHVMDDAQVSAVIVDAEHRPRLEETARGRSVRLIGTAAALDGAVSEAPSLPSVAEDRRALMVYTSGTTGRPKGAVHTHATLRAQIESLAGAWEWSSRDRTLLVLPLHHVHGIVNVQLCALWSGARCDVLAHFDAEATWDRIVAGDLTLFMAVPTIYSRLIAAWEAAPEDRRAAMTAGCRRMRLMVSGSAALPVSTLERWRTISGHTLLERYGMTEIGMALSNPLHGERRPGHVGTPLPGVEVRLVGDDGQPVPEAMPGEIEVRGPGVFLEYWNRGDETGAAFRDGWFRTGDLAVVEAGAFRILGRRSVDILKTGGFKVSALEIEDVLRDHPDVADCAVVGLPDEVWGERVAVMVVARSDATIDEDALIAWACERLAPYKVPRLVRTTGALPRNAMGKVVKSGVRTLLEESS
jgi:malonyl-CoA/methylmalonyl-CoA synthetase